MHNQKGLSLVELMIAVALGLILMTGVMKIFISSKVVFSTQQGLSRIQETGRLAIDYIARDVRMAGYYGASRANNNQFAFSTVNAPAPVGLHGNFDISIRGYDSSASLPALTALPHNVKTDLGIDAASATLMPDTSILVIRGANQTGTILTQENNANNLFVYTTSGVDGSTGCVGNICPNSALVVADNTKAYVFQSNTLSLAGTTLTVNHTSTWGGDGNPSTTFGSGAELLPVNTTVYFVATNIKTGIPSLYQRTNNRDAIQLLEGVENMLVTYSCTNNSKYRTASELSDAEWSNVQSIRVELLVRSIDDNVVETMQKYNFNGTSKDATDRRMRQSFITTITPRTRMIFN